MDTSFDQWADQGYPDQVNGATQTATHIRPELNERARGLSNALRSLDTVDAILTSRYLVKGWLDRDTTSVIYGESNVGKTFFAMDLALHVAAGVPWHGYKTLKGAGTGQVVYIASEGGRGMFNRIAAARKDNPDLINAASNVNGFLLLPTSLDLHGNNDADALTKALSEVGDTSLVIIDTLARTMGEGDENSTKDMGAFIRNLDAIRAVIGAHIMVVHHSGKDASKGARGSGSLRAVVDTEIELTRSEGVVMAEMRKQRDMACDHSLAYRLESVTIGTDEDGDEVTSAVVREAEPVKKTPRLSGSQKIAMQALSDALAHHGEAKIGDMFPSNRQCVSLEQWRSLCDRHSLSSGEGDSSRRTAFHKAKNALQDKEIVRFVDGFVWRCEA